MGDEQNKDLESRIKKLARAPLKLLRSYGVPIATAIGIGSIFWVQAMIAYQRVPSVEEFADCVKKAVLDEETWRNIFIAGSVFVGGIYGALAVRNISRKRKGKKPVKLLEFTKHVLFPWQSKKGEEGINELDDIFPDSSLGLRGLGDLQFKKGNIAEAMESYYKAMVLRDGEIFPKVPVIGTNSYVNAIKEPMPYLEKRLLQEPDNNQVLLELSMRNFLINDFDRAAGYFERVDKSQDPVALHTLAARFYSEISKRANRPVLRRFSAGDLRVGRFIDTLFRGKGHKTDGKDMEERAETETYEAVIAILNNPNHRLERIGEYEVYRVKLNSFIEGFVVVKNAGHANLARERKNEQVFRERVAKGKFKSVHPDGIAYYKGKPYLVLFHEAGAKLSASRNTRFFKMATEYAARSDALMPLDYIIQKEYQPKGHFEQRIAQSGLPEKVTETLLDGCGFLFKYSDAFPLVFDGDWHPDNCLVDDEGNIIALDKEDKGVTIGPVTAARILNQGTMFGSMEERENDNLKDGMIKSRYLVVYQSLVDKENRIMEPELFIPASLAAIIEKAITGYCFTRPLPARWSSTKIFLHKALNAGRRIRTDSAVKGFYSSAEKEQCAKVEAVIYEHLIPTTLS